MVPGTRTTPIVLVPTVQILKEIMKAAGRIRSQETGFQPASTEDWPPGNCGYCAREEFFGRLLRSSLIPNWAETFQSSTLTGS